MNSPFPQSPGTDFAHHQPHDERAARSGPSQDDPTHMFRRGHVWVGKFSPYAAGAAYQRSRMTDPYPPGQPLIALEHQLQNLYLPSFVRAFIRGRLDTLSTLPAAVAVDEVEVPKTTQTNNTMKLKETSAVIEALGQLVVALVALAFAFCKAIKGTSSEAAEEEEEEEEEVPPAKKQAKKQAKKTPPPAEEEESDDNLLDDGEEEEEEESSISIADLKAIGQKLLKAGKADKLKAVLKKHGAENLGGLDESKYTTVHEALKKVLG